VDKLTRKAFWACGAKRMRSSQVVTQTSNAKEARKRFDHEWQEDYSSRLCKNIYMLMSLIDIELLMFETKLENAINRKYWFSS
jgi:hypothetical protein